MNKVFGLGVDDQTRCQHYNTKYDVIAILFKCCNKFYACFKCHDFYESHPIKRWEKSEFDKSALLCGRCKNKMTISDYIKEGSLCPFCSAKFNKKCCKHWQLYFKL